MGFNLQEPLFSNAPTGLHLIAIARYRKELGLEGEGVQPSFAREAALMIRAYSRRIQELKIALSKKKNSRNSKKISWYR